MASPKTLSSKISPRTLSNTTIPKTAQAFLLELTAEFPRFSWRLGSRFKYHAGSIFIDKNSIVQMPYFALLTLHELGHALCHHAHYNTDIERLRIEAEAWQRAKLEISRHPNWQKFGISYDETFAEDQLDSYRDWLHQKSKCKNCGLTKFQTSDGKYHCPTCDLL